MMLGPATRFEPSTNTRLPVIGTANSCENSSCYLLNFKIQRSWFNRHRRGALFNQYQIVILRLFRRLLSFTQKTVCQRFELAKMLDLRFRSGQVPWFAFA